ncbi:MOSC N-terminal beta barrel domain-containing protein [soil metagenome]
MPIISGLTIYPIKSCAGISVSRAMVTATGLSVASLHDREWMLVDFDGMFLTQREFPRMASIRPTIEGTQLVVHAPGMAAHSIDIMRTGATPASSLPVQIWEETVSAIDSGEASAAWFSAALGVACKLVRFLDPAKRAANPKWTSGHIASPVTTRFSDGFPFVLISQASLDDLNQRCTAQGRTAVPMNRFRPNIVIDGVEAFEEDYAASFSIEQAAPLETICLAPVKPCPRCPIPAVDQSTGEVGPNPVEVLQSYRANPLVDGGICFGMNTIVTHGAGQYLALGDTVQLHLAF